MRASVREPAVAGQFYPADAEALARLVDSMLDTPPIEPDEPLARAYVVPHAGYRYSGPTASYVYSRLRARGPDVRRVVLIGPAHYAPLKGCAVPGTDAWLTPLGAVPIDMGGCAALVRAGRAAIGDGPHGPEHSLEVQLPFLQRALPDDILVLPVVVGQSTVDDVTAMIADAVAVAPDGTVVVCSSDLSHYLDEASANRQDERTAHAVLDLAAKEIGVRDACGVYALRGLVGWAAKEGLTPRLLHRCTSADTAGDPSRVVGYSAFSFR